MTDFDILKEKTIYELEKELKDSAHLHKRFKIKACIILFFIWLILCPDMFMYLIRFITPHFPKYKTEEIIDVTKEPIQIDITQNKDKYFKYKTLENRGSFAMEKMAKYSISGLLVAKNYFFWSNYLPLIRDVDFHAISLIDVGLVYQEMANEDIMKCVKYISFNVFDGARQLIPIPTHSDKCSALFYQYANQVGGFDELFSKYSHTHVIPANASIMHALMFAPQNKPVKLEGYLVDVYKDGTAIASTSLSRRDNNITARGGGACEVMYVERVQVGNKVYE